MQGFCKWFNAALGYGFIVDQTGSDVFVHFSGILGEGYKSLQEGEEVEFELQTSPKGPIAVNVRRLQPGRVDGDPQPDPMRPSAITFGRPQRRS